MSVSCKTIVKNERGIHARPSSLIAKEALNYNSEITIKHDDRVADGKDVLQIIMLELFQGTEVEIIASGEDEEKALSAIKEIIESEFQFD